MSEEAIELDWNKLKRNSEKAGYREGIDAGRASQFQESFDEGYKSGFKNGFELGKLKAEHRGSNSSSLENTRRGNCIICKDETLMEKPTEEVATLQWTSTHNQITGINTKNRGSP